MHATDFSRASTAALKRAIAMAKADRAQLIIVHVMTPPSLALPGDGYVSPRLYEELEASARAQAQKRLDAIVAQARKAGARATGLPTGAPGSPSSSWAAWRRGWSPACRARC